MGVSARRFSLSGEALDSTGTVARHLAVGLVFSALATLMAAAALLGGGSDDTSLPWIGGAAVVIVALLLAGGFVDLWPVPVPSTLALAGLGLLVAFVAWNGLSVFWSFAPDLSWSYFNRGVTYIGLLGVGLIFGALVRRAPTVFASLAALIVAAALVWALAGKIDPSLFEDGARRVRMREPVGIWNLLAVLLALGIPLGFWLTTRRNAIVVRALGVGFLFLLVPAFALTLSRSGIIVAALGVVLWLALAPGRVESLVVLVLFAPAGLGVARWALDRPGLAEEGQSFAQRAAGGRLLGIYLAVGFIAAVAAAFFLAAVERNWPIRDVLRRRLNIGAGVLVGLVVVVLALAFVARVGNPVTWVDEKIDEATSDVLISDDASRLTSASLNARLDWWREAGRAFRDEPVLGTGAGSFPVVHRIYRSDELNVLEPHNVPLQFLAETGVIGFALFVTGALVLLIAAGVAVRRVGAADHVAALAIFLCAVIYAVHSVVEVDWDFVAVSGPVFLGLGVLLGTGRAQDVGYGRGMPALPAFALAGLCVSLAHPAAACGPRRHAGCRARPERSGACARRRAACRTPQPACRRSPVCRGRCAVRARAAGRGSKRIRQGDRAPAEELRHLAGAGGVRVRRGAAR